MGAPSGVPFPIFHHHFIQNTVISFLERENIGLCVCVSSRSTGFLSSNPEDSVVLQWRTRRPAFYSSIEASSVIVFNSFKVQAPRKVKSAEKTFVEKGT
ncbi:hypothetical protein L1987_21429 [Smallanthus sonchifolius]|uniref:Uncharacterized protein n=1 Tax=Smallanthus sonchifolius TaxID=185202 RepID=A0ACB9IWG9_9ASTR|nr:hypothetical protein L1987_21429 [Smallanthus sonchifolius]